MGNWFVKMGENAEHEGMGGNDPETTGTSQGDISGEGDTPGGAPGPRMINDGFNKPKIAIALPYNHPAMAYSAPPQQTDIQNNFSTSSQYAQRYGLAGRVHF